MPAPGMHSGVATDDALNLSMSEHAVPLYEAVKAFIANEVEPITEEFYRLGEGRAEHWGYGEGQLELLDGVKAKAKANGLWNFFLPDAETGEGLSNLDYAYIAQRAGQEPARLGVPQLQRARHRQHGGARAGRHAGAEGAVAQAAAGRRDPLGLRHDRARRRLVGRQEHRLPGRARRRRVGDQRREVLHLRRRRPALQDHDRHGADEPRRAAAPRQSQILVPMDTPGVEILGAMHVFGEDDAPHGHMHLRFTDVRVPEGEHPARRGARLRDLPGPPRARAASTTACARSAPPSGRSS